MLMVFGLVFVLPFAHAENTCEPRLRAVFDVGSGTIKMNLSEVEVCAREVRLRRLLDDQASAPSGLEAGKHKTGELSDASMSETLQAVRMLKRAAFTMAKRKAPQYGSIDFAAAGTHAVRTAKNAAAFARKMEAAGVPLMTLSQDEEARLGFEGAKTRKEDLCKEDPPLVWDVGSGSMQWTWDESRKTKPLGVDLGAEGFKMRLIQELGLPGRSPDGCSVPEPTPNPLQEKNVDKARHFARHEAAKRMRPLQQKLALRPGKTCVIGIGGVHTKAVEAQITRHWDKIAACACGTKPACSHTVHRFTRQEVECLEHYLSSKTDCDPEIKGPYSTTSVSNLFLIDGFMRHLGIEEIHTANVNMTHQLVLDRRRLRFKTSSIPKN